MESRAAALGVGVSFAGAALILLALTGSVWLACFVFGLGVLVTAFIRRRHHLQEAGALSPAPRAVEAVEQAITDLRSEAEATHSVLERAAAHRLELERAAS